MLPIANTLVSKVAASPVAAVASARLLYNATATAGIAIYKYGTGGDGVSSLEAGTKHLGPK